MTKAAPPSAEDEAASCCSGSGNPLGISHPRREEFALPVYVRKLSSRVRTSGGAGETFCSSRTMLNATAVSSDPTAMWRMGTFRDESERSRQW